MSHAIDQTKPNYAAMALSCVAAFFIAFPLAWMLLMSFKTDANAAQHPFDFAPAMWTLKSYKMVFKDQAYFLYLLNSIITAFGSTFLALALALPAAWSLTFAPSPHRSGVMIWILSTKMMPAIGILMPVFLIYNQLHLLDTPLGLILMVAAGNLPIIIWMLFSYFKDIPYGIIEAARMDGASVSQEIFAFLLPMAAPGIASTALLSIILAWNESFWTINLSGANAAPLTAFIASFSSPQGLFWARLSAASCLSVAPILLVGWLCQKHLVRGLTFGAVK
jgi:sorbitol/mannitol transport system permease protein